MQVFHRNYRFYVVLMWVFLSYVIGVKKPAGTSEEIEKHFGCQSSHLIMVDKIHRPLELFYLIFV